MSVVQIISPDRLDEIVDVLCDAFHDYPVMRYLVGPGHADYDVRLQRLIGFFAYRRGRMGAPYLGVSEGNALVAVAAFTLPVEPEIPADIFARRDALWRDLGDDARIRYDTYANTTKAFTIAAPHHHLNMIGVRHTHHGRGLARPLLDDMARRSREDANSAGVSLTTELARNVTLYEHFGYRVVGHARVSPDLETWGFFWDKNLRGPGNL
jgi:GNAT superfamily N-acetyltransferase